MRLVEVVASYLPSTIVSYLVDHATNEEVQLPSRQDMRTACMFLDVSGFTALSEAMGKRGAGPGANALASHLNAYFAQMVKIIGGQGGDIIKFAGDAMLVLWPPDTAEPLPARVQRACQAALEVQRVCHNAHLAEGVCLSVKIGIAAGPLSLLHLGGVLQRAEYVAVGEPLAAAFAAEHHATSGGQVWVSQDAYKLMEKAGGGPGVEPLFTIYDTESDAVCIARNGVGHCSRPLKKVGKGQVAASGGMQGMMAATAASSSGSSVPSPLPSPSTAVSPGAATTTTARRRTSLFDALLGSNAPAASSGGASTSGNGTATSASSSASGTGTGMQTHTRRRSSGSGAANAAAAAAATAAHASALHNGMLTTVAAPAASTVAAASAHRSVGEALQSASGPELERRLRAYVPGAILPYLDPECPENEAWGGSIRKVSVLFLNLGLSERDLVAAAKYGDALDRTQAVLQAVQHAVYGHEGAINKFLMDDKGSTMVTVFGLAPLWHEDDAARALLAAVQVCQLLAGLGCIASGGVATGTAFCGVVGSTTRKEYTVLGDTVNLAARLMQYACTNGGGVVACASTAEEAAARSGLCLQELPAITVKGKSNTVRLFRPVMPSDTGVQSLPSGDGPETAAVHYRALYERQLTSSLQAAVMRERVQMPGLPQPVSQLHELTRQAMLLAKAAAPSPATRPLVTSAAPWPPATTHAGSLTPIQETSSAPQSGSNSPAVPAIMASGHALHRAAQPPQVAVLATSGSSRGSTGTSDALPQPAAPTFRAVATTARAVSQWVRIRKTPTIALQSEPRSSDAAVENSGGGVGAGGGGGGGVVRLTAASLFQLPQAAPAPSGDAVQVGAVASVATKSAVSKLLSASLERRLAPLLHSIGATASGGAGARPGQAITLTRKRSVRPAAQVFSRTQSGVSESSAWDPDDDDVDGTEEEDDDSDSTGGSDGEATADDAVAPRDWLKQQGYAVLPAASTTATSATSLLNVVFLRSPSEVSAERVTVASPAATRTFSVTGADTIDAVKQWADAVRDEYLADGDELQRSATELCVLSSGGVWLRVPYWALSQPISLLRQFVVAQGSNTVQVTSRAKRHGVSGILAEQSSCLSALAWRAAATAAADGALSGRVCSQLVLLEGPSGTGKTHVANQLLLQCQASVPALCVAALAASPFQRKQPLAVPLRLARTLLSLAADCGRLHGVPLGLQSPSTTPLRTNPGTSTNRSVRVLTAPPVQAHAGTQPRAGAAAAVLIAQLRQLLKDGACTHSDATLACVAELILLDEVRPLQPAASDAARNMGVAPAAAAPHRSGSGSGSTGDSDSEGDAEAPTPGFDMRSTLRCLVDILCCLTSLCGPLLLLVDDSHHMHAEGWAVVADMMRQCCETATTPTSAARVTMVLLRRQHNHSADVIFPDAAPAYAALALTASGGPAWLTHFQLGACERQQADGDRAAAAEALAQVLVAALTPQLQSQLSSDSTAAWKPAASLTALLLATGTDTPAAAVELGLALLQRVALTLAPAEDGTAVALGVDAGAVSPLLSQQQVALSLLQPLTRATAVMLVDRLPSDSQLLLKAIAATSTYFTAGSGVMAASVYLSALCHVMPLPRLRDPKLLLDLLVPLVELHLVRCSFVTNPTASIGAPLLDVCIELLQSLALDVALEALLADQLRELRMRQQELSNGTGKRKTIDKGSQDAVRCIVDAKEVCGLSCSVRVLKQGTMQQDVGGAQATSAEGATATAVSAPVWWPWAPSNVWKQRTVRIELDDSTAEPEPVLLLLVPTRDTAAVPGASSHSAATIPASGAARSLASSWKADKTLQVVYLKSAGITLDSSPRDASPVATAAAASGTTRLTITASRWIKRGIQRMEQRSFVLDMMDGDTARKWRDMLLQLSGQGTGSAGAAPSVPSPSLSSTTPVLSPLQLPYLRIIQETYNVLEMGISMSTQQLCGCTGCNASLYAHAAWCSTGGSSSAISTSHSVHCNVSSSWKFKALLADAPDVDLRIDVSCISCDVCWQVILPASQIATVRQSCSAAVPSPARVQLQLNRCATQNEHAGIIALAVVPACSNKTIRSGSLAAPRTTLRQLFAGVGPASATSTSSSTTAAAAPAPPLNLRLSRSISDGMRPARSVTLDIQADVRICSAAAAAGALTGTNLGGDKEHQQPTPATAAARKSTRLVQSYAEGDHPDPGSPFIVASAPPDALPPLSAAAVAAAAGASTRATAGRRSSLFSSINRRRSSGGSSGTATAAAIFSSMGGRQSITSVSAAPRAGLTVSARAAADARGQVEEVISRLQQGHQADTIIPALQKVAVMLQCLDMSNNGWSPHQPQHNGSSHAIMAAAAAAGLGSDRPSRCDARRGSTTSGDAMSSMVLSNLAKLDPQQLMWIAQEYLPFGIGGRASPGHGSSTATAALATHGGGSTGCAVIDGIRVETPEASSTRASLLQADSVRTALTRIGQPTAGVGAVPAAPEGEGERVLQPVAPFIAPDQEALGSWDYDLWSLGVHSPPPVLSSVAVSIMLGMHALHQQLPFRPCALQTFIQTVMVQMASHGSATPYHNQWHALDTLQTVSCLLLQMGGRHLLTAVETAAVLIAALSHDLDHPGTNNAYHVVTGSELALLYNDTSVLEHHHASTAFRLMTRFQFPVGWPRELWQALRRAIIACILATDMTCHFALLDELRSLNDDYGAMILEVLGGDAAWEVSEVEDGLYSQAEEGDEQEEEEEQEERQPLSDADRNDAVWSPASPLLSAVGILDEACWPAAARSTLMKGIVHAADISNPAKQWRVSKRWSDLVLAEFCLQGDRERREGLPLSPNCDRSTVNQARMTITFLGIIVNPLYDVLAAILPQLNGTAVATLATNKEKWQQIAQEQDAEAQIAAMVVPLPPPLPPS